MAQLRGRRTHLTGICNNQLQWCQNPEIEHGGTTTGPARRSAKPNGGRESGRSRWQCYAASGNSRRTAQSACCSSDWVLADTATSPIGVPRMANAIRSGCPAEGLAQPELVDSVQESPAHPEHPLLNWRRSECRRDLRTSWTCLVSTRDQRAVGSCMPAACEPRLTSVTAAPTPLAMQPSQHIPAAE